MNIPLLVINTLQFLLISCKKKKLCYFIVENVSYSVICEERKKKCISDFQRHEKNDYRKVL